MTPFRDVPAEQRFEQGFTDPQGQPRAVWADYVVRNDARIITHVEAADELRGAYFGICGEVLDAGLCTIADLNMGIDIALILNPEKLAGLKRRHSY